MKNINFSIWVSIFVLIGCGSNNSENTISLQGKTWINEGCNILIETDNNNTKHTTFYKDLYRFDSDNTVYFGSNVYSDNSCQKIIKRYPIQAPESKDNWVYYTIGEESTNNEYDVYSIYLGLKDTMGAGGTPITIDDIKAGNLGDNPFFSEGSYAIKQDRVCFSENLYQSSENNYTSQDITPILDNMNILYWKHESLVVASYDSKIINYERCLTLY